MTGAPNRRVWLPDGAELEVRPIAPDDKAVLERGLERLGSESRYRRFLAPTRRLGARELRYLTEVDHHDHEALLATEAGTAEGVGVARFVRLAEDPRAAEFAVTVIDDWQGRGVGTLLLRLLADRAREEGVERFRGLMLADNRPIRELVGLLGEPRVLERRADTIEVEVDLPPAGAGRSLQSMLRAAARGVLTLRRRDGPGPA